MCLVHKIHIFLLYLLCMLCLVKPDLHYGNQIGVGFNKNKNNYSHYLLITLQNNMYTNKKRAYT